MKFLLLILGLLAISSNILVAEEVPFPNLTPTQLLVHIGGFGGPNYSVELKGDTVIYQATGAGISREKNVSIHPDQATWSRFLKEINEAKLYRWSKDYPNHGVMDGTQWSITMEIDGRKIYSRGSNNYPTDGNEAKPTNSAENSRSFNLFCEAISHLVGQEFR